MKPIEITIKSTTKEMAEMVNQVAKEARIEALEEVRHMLLAKANMMKKVLDRGHEIWMASKGSRFDKLYEQRGIVWRRWMWLHSIAGEILKSEMED